MPYTVYTMTNKDDTHIYVGSTKRYKDRCYDHMYLCKRGKHQHKIQALYNQIGPAGFEFDAVEEYATKAEAREAEQRWVDYYLAAPEWELLNIATENVSAATCNPEVAAKMASKVSAALKGKKKTAEHRANMSEAHKGKKFSAEHRAKMSEAHKGKNAKPVYVKWADGSEQKFESATEASKQLGCSGALVGYWMNGKSTTYTKPKWGIAEIRWI